MWARENASQQLGEFMNAYCVILSRQPSVDTTSYARSKRFYLNASTADRAMRIASDENPQFRVVGVEPSDLYSLLPQGDRSSTPSRSEAA
jgi:hypothetical protein